MSMPIMEFDQYEAESLEALSDHFEKVRPYLEVDRFYRYEEVGSEQVTATIDKFVSHQLVEYHSRSSIRIDL